MSRVALAEMFGHQAGRVTADVYSTAWVALVPSRHDLNRPAWPQALEYIRSSQLADGGWGDDRLFYAYDRTISTLAAIRALLTWEGPGDAHRVERGVAALHHYAAALDDERYESIGFELLLPSFITFLEGYDLAFPEAWWANVKILTAKKLSLLGNLKIDYDQPRSWWFSMEMLPADILSFVHDAILNEFGAIAVATSTTAAYLRARRLQAEDSPRAATYLDYVMHTAGEGVSQLWPVDSFELTWSVDAFLRAGLPPTHPELAPIVDRVETFWQRSPVGLSYSVSFPYNDGDCTAMGYHVLRAAGRSPAPEILAKFWNERYFVTYPRELNFSVSANVHALTALSHHAHEPRYWRMGQSAAAWLREQMDEHGALHDKWHLSPFYSTSRAILPLLVWDREMARRCVEFLLSSQTDSGGWGVAGVPNLEDSSHAVLGLITARRAGLLDDDVSLRRAASYLAENAAEETKVRLWIGKALYRPIGVIQAIRLAAHIALEIEGFLPDSARAARVTASSLNREVTPLYERA